VQAPIRLGPPGERAFDVVGLGQNSTDLVAHVRSFPVVNSKQRLLALDRLPGGQVASAMVCCARLGWRARYVGTFGDDEGGAMGRASLVAEGVDAGAAATVTGARTRTAIVIVDDGSGERTVLWDRDPALVLGAADGSCSWTAKTWRPLLRRRPSRETPAS
jgi:sugar/nucleoside kinase (ribokinase family)